MMSASSDRLALEDRRQAGREPIEQRPAGDHAVLDDLVEAGAELAARQRGEQLRIDRHRQGLMKRADQVLAERVVDADLAADRAVHLRQQRRRHLHDRDAAQERRGRKAGDVADHPAADGDDRRGAVRAGADQRVVDPADGRELLIALAVRDQDRFLGGELFEDRAVQAPDGGLETTNRRAGALIESSSDRAALKSPRRSRRRRWPTAYGQEFAAAAERLGRRSWVRATEYARHLRERSGDRLTRSGW